MRDREEPRVACSKALTRVLRHDAGKWTLSSMGPDGFVMLDELLMSVPYLQGFTQGAVEECVRLCEKKRFSMESRGGVKYIRANQGHTMNHVQDAALLQRVESPEEVPVCIHGTYRKCRAAIERDGLSVMKRNHIHFAVGLPGEGGVISGMRRDSEVICELDIATAMADGIEFFRSDNDVILTRGVDNSGILPPTYFKTYSVEEYVLLTYPDPESPDPAGDPLESQPLESPKDGRVIRSAGVIILTGEGKFHCIKRRNRHGGAKGHFELAKTKVRENENDSDAAVRALFEEGGIELSATKITYSDTQTYNHEGKKKEVIWFVHYSQWGLWIDHSRHSSLYSTFKTLGDYSATTRRQRLGYGERLGSGQEQIVSKAAERAARLGYFPTFPSSS